MSVAGNPCHPPKRSFAVYPKEGEERKLEADAPRSDHSQESVTPKPKDKPDPKPAVEVFDEGISSFFASIPQSDRKWRLEHFAKSGNVEKQSQDSSQYQKCECGKSPCTCASLSSLVSVAKECGVVELLRSPPQTVPSSLVLTAILYGKVCVCGERERVGGNG